MNRFRIKTQVLPEHIDNLGHVNNVQYLHWVQTVAHEHWEELTRMITEPLGFWVVRSHNITFKNEAFEFTLKFIKLIPEVNINYF